MKEKIFIDGKAGSTDSGVLVIKAKNKFCLLPALNIPYGVIRKGYKYIEGGIG